MYISRSIATEFMIMDLLIWLNSYVSTHPHIIIVICFPLYL